MLQQVRVVSAQSLGKGRVKRRVSIEPGVGC